MLEVIEEEMNFTEYKLSDVKLGKEKKYPSEECSFSLLPLPSLVLPLLDGHGHE